MVELRIIEGGWKPRRPGTNDAHGQLLQAIIDHLDGARDAHIKALMKQHADLRREAYRREMHRQIQRSEAELPADVPLHKRGFGVMDDPDG